MYYLNARMYDPATSRMLSEAPHWNPNNMIYGDNPVRINERIRPIRPNDLHICDKNFAI